ncbi:hypothetical protein [Methanogenium organophilum]|uniref:Uncharacterized protein n=1 Tax=Methanogenium organophilum TaxID=2199 RepID=A0A9X9S3G7_METOG|nr:hypothetical protein [Methanogenium organophilum]WAI00991.1 hypothetical protein OU421_11305 [Methanogenium organophilum]
MQFDGFISKAKGMSLGKVLLLSIIVFNSFILALFLASGPVYLLFEHFEMLSFGNLYAAALIVSILLAASAITLLSLKLLDHNRGITIGIHMVLFALFGSLFIGMLYHDIKGSTAPGEAIYFISISGLEDKSGSLINEFVVPLPMLNNGPLLPLDELNNKKFGEWNTVVIGFQNSTQKMLAIQHIGPNLTEIEDEISFYYRFDDPIKIDAQNTVYLSSLTTNLDDIMVVIGDKEESGRYYYQSEIFVPDNLKSVNDTDSMINIKVLLKVDTGESWFDRGSSEYIYSINESVNINNSGRIPVTVDVGVNELYELYYDFY